jgi:hypothetical protein
MMRELTQDAPVADGRVVPMPRRSNANGAKEPPAPSNPPIDFTPAAQKVQQARASQAMITVWANFAGHRRSVDVYVAHGVRQAHLEPHLPRHPRSAPPGSASACSSPGRPSRTPS